MSTIQVRTAEAFSSHRFAEAYDRLAEDVSWVSVGGSTIRGRAAVIEACEQTLAELKDVTTGFRRFVTVAGGDAVAVDAVGEYVDADQGRSVVSSCDIYEFTGGEVATITSYAVELEPGDEA